MSLNPQDNELLTRVGRGTAMGTLLRSYCFPILLSSDLPEPGGRPMRMKLLGESLVAFRNSEGQVGLIQERCPHRGASLAFGRNEDGGIRCVYHGWKFDVRGTCVDLPSEPAERQFQSRVKTTAYPCFERSGMVWTYMGAGDAPPLPDIEWGLVPEGHRYVSRRVLECNWAQALEGDIDSSHASFLHSRLEETDYNQFVRSKSIKYMDRDRHPVFDVVDTDYGLMIAARRNAEIDTYYWRVTQVILPFFTIPAPYEDEPIRGNFWFPMDDAHTLVWTIDWHPSRPLSKVERELRDHGLIGHCTEFLPEMPQPAGRWFPRTNRNNDYNLDYERQRTEQFSGIREIWAQDKAVAESLGPIADRTLEFLGTSDTGIVRWRRRILSAARELAQKGEMPPGLKPGSQLVRPASYVSSRYEPWRETSRPHIRGGLGVPIHPASI